MTGTTNMRTFYTLILTQTLSLIGSRISGLAIGIWVFSETGDATPLTLVSFFMVLPMVLASSISGVLADRWDRRYVMIAADAGQALGTVLLFISFASGDFQLWHLYSVAFIQSIFGVFQGPAFQASITMLIPDEKREVANSIQQMTQPAANIVAPVVTGMLYGLLGVRGSILVDLATFVIAMVVVFSIAIPRPETTEAGLQERGSLWFESWTGLRWLRSNPTMMSIVLYISLVNFLVGGVMALSIPYILARTDSAEALGIIQGITSMGAIVGAIIIGSWGGTRPRMNTIMPGLIIGGFFLAIAGTARTALPLAVVLFLFMLPLPMINTLFMSIMQAKTPPDIQGRVFAVLGQISMLLTPVAYLIVGPLADNVFEPAVGAAGWDTVSPLVGDGAGAGMGLMFLGAGILVFAISVFVYSRANVRHVEAIMPDYKPVATAPQIETPLPETDDIIGIDPVPGTTAI